MASLTINIAIYPYVREVIMLYNYDSGIDSCNDAETTVYLNDDATGLSDASYVKVMNSEGILVYAPAGYYSYNGYYRHWAGEAWDGDEVACLPQDRTEIELYYSESDVDICSQVPDTTFFIESSANSFLDAQYLFTNSLGDESTLAPAGYYFTDAHYRYWDGEQFTADYYCGS